MSKVRSSPEVRQSMKLLLLSIFLRILTFDLAVFLHFAREGVSLSQFLFQDGRISGFITREPYGIACRL
ncbi:hypothetical protein BDW71DRAFT_190506, partial [Aspergillus fruticulosus]